MTEFHLDTLRNQFLMPTAEMLTVFQKARDGALELHYLCDVD
jgi:hypothetical protein